MRIKLLLSFILMALLAPSPSFAYDFEVNGFYYNITSMSNLEVEITYKSIDTWYAFGGNNYAYKNESYSGDIIIPETVNYNNRTYTVTKIGQYAFGCNPYVKNVSSNVAQAYTISTKITSIKIPNTVKVIEDYTFNSCTELKKVDFPESLKEIPTRAFYGCTALDNLQLPEGLETIGEYAFYNISIDNLTIPNSTKTIGSSAFSNCSNLSYVICGRSLSSIGTDAFYYCPKLMEVFYTNINAPSGKVQATNSYMESYVPSVKNYGFGIEYVTFKENTFDYTGQTHNIEWTNNLKAYRCEIADCITQDNNAGTHTQYLTATYSNGVDFSVEIPYEYKINKAPMSLAVNDAQREYGDSNPTFRSSIIGWVNGENEQSIGASTYYECDATPRSNVGTYRILASLDAPNYDITYKYGTLTVSKAPLELSIKDSSKVYGDSNPQFEFSCSGLKNGETSPVWDIAPSFVTTANETSPAGQYEVSASNGETKNYDIVYKPGILTVTKRELSAKVFDSERLYGEENPDFRISYFGFINGDSEADILEEPKAECSATAISNVGEYPITLEGGNSTNYTFNYQNGVLTINPRELSVSVGNYERPYGEENPEFELVYTGFINNDNSDSLNQKPEAATSAIATSDVGDYEISISGGEDDNYNFNYTSGTLSVIKADQEIVWNQDFYNAEIGHQIELEAYATSGLPVTYELNDSQAADIYSAGNKLYLDCMQEGVVELKAFQDGNGNYNPATRVVKQIAIRNSSPSDKPVLSITQMPVGTISTAVDHGSVFTFRVTTINGYSINSIAINGEDQTDLLDGDNTFTTPAITDDMEIIISYSDTAGSIDQLGYRDIKVLGNSNGILVKNAPINEYIRVYTVDGTLIKSLLVDNDEMSISLLNNQIYIVKICDSNFKIRL